MILTPGTRLGPYELLSALGAGGMGEVWKARDTRLNRLVAIKASQSAFSERFEREARAIAAVNHRHVCSLYDIGPDYLVMEYVEGKSPHGPLPVAQALDLADQILDALDAAHRSGVVHRDLKPGNILLTKSGVKVLDFGLAKITSGSHGPDLADTQADSITVAGSVLGTLPYMSPEQVEGRDADARSDIFAFGIVLYELIAGTRPFAGQTPANLIASILTDQPRPLDEVQPATPRGVAEVVRRCLEKDPEQRWQSARDVQHALKLSAVAPAPAIATAPAQAGASRVWQIAAGVMTVLALGIGAWALRPAAPAAPARFEASVPDETRLEELVSVSPDGRMLAFASDGIWVRAIDAVEWRHLPGTEGASSLFWSPDSRYIGFPVEDAVKKVDATGGPPETLATFPAGSGPQSGAWNRQGDILVGSWGGGSGGAIWRMSATGGTPTPITQVDLAKGEFVHTWPTFLPDGTSFLYFRSGPADVEGMYVGSIGVDAASQSRQRVLATNVPAAFANGQLFFVRAGTLLAQPFDVRGLALQGEPVRLADGVDVTWYFTGAFAVSDSGAFVYRTEAPPGSFQLTWVDRQGTAVGTIGPPGTDERVVLSPDGKRAVAKDSPYNVPGDLWMIDLASGRRTRFTFSKDVYSPAVWSPDGARIAYSAGRLGDTIYEKPASGLGDAQALFKKAGLRHFPTSWSRDGRFLLYHTENAPNTGYDVWALSMSDRTPHLLLGRPFNEWAAVFSPDMRWMAFVSLETSPPQVYVRPFRVAADTGVPSLGEGRWQVSKDYGNWPQWRTDREILFNSAPTGTQVFAASVDTTGGGFDSGIPQPLPFPASTGVSNTPQASADGQRFLVEVTQARKATRSSSSLSVVLNWPALVKR